MGEVTNKKVFDTESTIKYFHRLPINIECGILHDAFFQPEYIRIFLDVAMTNKKWIGDKVIEHLDSEKRLSSNTSIAGKEFINPSMKKILSHKPLQILSNVHLTPIPKVNPTEQVLTQEANHITLER